MPDPLQLPSQPVGNDASTEALVGYAPIQTDYNTGINEDINQDGDSPTDGYLITSYEVKSRWIFNDGLIAVPLAKRPTDPPPDMEFLRLHKPLAFLAVDWECARYGQPPIVPKPYLQNTNLKLLRQEYDISSVTRDGDGRLFFYAAGTYTYGLSDRKSATLSHAVPPWIQIMGGEIVVWLQGGNPAQFQDNIIDNQWPNASAASSVLTQP